MEEIDDAAATNIQLVQEKLQAGPWNTGVLGLKGSTVTEPLDTLNPSNQDKIKRYTDRYLRHHQIGRTVDDFPFNPKFLPSELHKTVKLDTVDVKPENVANKNKLAQRIAGIVTEEEDQKEDEDEKEDDDIEEEDEFEEMEDDDYNAEKYFDDGEDYGDIDDGDNEAAY